MAPTHKVVPLNRADLEMHAWKSFGQFGTREASEFGFKCSRLNIYSLYETGVSAWCVQGLISCSKVELLQVKQK